MGLFEETILNTYGSLGKAWLERLPALLEKYLRQWNLTVDGSFENLRFNFVVPVRCKNLKPAVLKMGPHLKGRLREYETLKYFAEGGAVKVLEFSEDDGVLLLEKISESRELAYLQIENQIDESKATEIAGAVMKTWLAVQSENTIAPKLPLVSVWGLGFEKFLRENCRGTAFPHRHIHQADAIFKELVKTTVEAKPLHGDLHASNILSDANEHWTVIDPKGVCGDPAYELGAYIRNPLKLLLAIHDREAVLKKRILFLSEALGFDPKRVWGWAYSQCVLAAIWAVQDSTETWQDWLIIADSLENVKPSFE